MNPKPLPVYYTSLGPFQETFRSGFPLLTYHHIARRRRGARIKGLYLQPQLFDTQLSELRRAGFCAGNYSLLPDLMQQTAALPQLAQATRESGQDDVKPVFITFDDAFRDVLENGLPILRRHGFAAMLFVVAKFMGKTNEWQQRAGDVPEPLMTEAEIRDWLAAGQQIGSHTLTHPRLTQLTQEAAWEEINASKKALEDRFGLPVPHFCYPYGAVDEKLRELAIKAGYETACTTVAGINKPGSDRFMLKRFTARYASRNWKSLWQGIRRVLRLL